MDLAFRHFLMQICFSQEDMFLDTDKSVCGSQNHVEFKRVNTLNLIAWVALGKFSFHK